MINKRTRLLIEKNINTPHKALGVYTMLLVSRFFWTEQDHCEKGWVRVDGEERRPKLNHVSKQNNVRFFTGKKMSEASDAIVKFLNQLSDHLAYNYRSALNPRNNWFEELELLCYDIFKESIRTYLNFNTLSDDLRRKARRFLVEVKANKYSIIDSTKVGSQLIESHAVGIDPTLFPETEEDDFDTSLWEQAMRAEPFLNKMGPVVLYVGYTRRADSHKAFIIPAPILGELYPTTLDLLEDPVNAKPSQRSSRYCVSCGGNLSMFTVEIRYCPFCGNAHPHGV